jgi:hypothetical protein
MITKTIRAVDLKRRLQIIAEKKLEGMTSDEQLKYLRRKYGQSAAKKMVKSNRKKS